LAYTFYTTNSGEPDIVGNVKQMISDIGQVAPIKGCSEAELKLLESTLNILLPEPYKVFLRYFGHGDGGGGGYFFEDSDWMYSCICESTLFVRDILNDCDKLSEIPQQFIVFASLYNECFYLLDIFPGQHQIYLWDRTENKIIIQYSSLWNLIIENLYEIIRIKDTI
jgi:SMI1 / KNR4 family (SUKH-1)